MTFVRRRLVVVLLLLIPPPVSGQAPATTTTPTERLTVEAAVAEAIDKNLDLIAKRMIWFAKALVTRVASKPVGTG